MSGHNKWSKIKHRKAATDAEKSKVFGKLAHSISIEAKKAKGDVNAPGLRAVIEKARQANMPTENIMRAVEKGRVDTGDALKEVLYEAYGPNGVAIVILGITDNRNRTGSEIKHVLAEHGVVLAEPGAALWAFEKTGGAFRAKTTLPISPEDREKLEAIKSALRGHEDIDEVYTNSV